MHMMAGTSPDVRRVQILFGHGSVQLFINCGASEVQLGLDLVVLL